MSTVFGEHLYRSHFFSLLKVNPSRRGKPNVEKKIQEKGNLEDEKHEKLGTNVYVKCVKSICFIICSATSLNCQAGYFCRQELTDKKKE